MNFFYCGCVRLMYCLTNPIRLMRNNKPKSIKLSPVEMKQEDLTKVARKACLDAYGNPLVCPSGTKESGLHIEYEGNEIKVLGIVCDHEIYYCSNSGDSGSGDSGSGGSGSRGSDDSEDSSVKLT